MMVSCSLHGSQHSSITPNHLHVNTLSSRLNLIELRPNHYISPHNRLMVDLLENASSKHLQVATRVNYDFMHKVAELVIPYTERSSVGVLKLCWTVNNHCVHQLNRQNGCFQRTLTFKVAFHQMRSSGSVIGMCNW